MNQTRTLLKERLHRAGLRATRQRLDLGELLFQGDHRHVTAEQLHSEARHTGIRVSLATVYNTLNQFTAAGLLRAIAVDPRRSYFDTNTSNHHHFFHADDGSLEDIPADRIDVGRLPPPPQGTRVAGVEVVIRVSGKADPELF